MNKKILNFNFIYSSNFLLFSIIIFIILIDKIYHSFSFYLPAWDQGYHLANLFKTYNIFENVNINSFDWWDKLWGITDTYRGPLTYIFSSTFLHIFGKSYENSLISNNLFSIIIIICIFNLSKEIGSKKAGLWGALIFALNPYIFDQRVDYLIDISQVCFINLNFYILYKFYKSKGGYIISFLLGITLGFVFLTKPTGLFFLIIPYIYTLYIYLKDYDLLKKKLINLLLIIISFLIIIWPWLSINWLTIITSIYNSWQWGIKYQDGLEANTFDGLIFYPKVIIKLLNPLILGSFFVIAIIDKLKLSSNYRFKINKSKLLNQENIFLLSLPVNILIICTLMSTKDLRFILPIFPSLCIFSGLFISKLKKYYFMDYYKLFIFIIILSNFIFHVLAQINLYKQPLQKSLSYWPHQEIIREVSSFSPNINSVIAILPDTKELNTFNLAAEANLQNNLVDIRQIISNEKSSEDDLKRFNWFLIKDGDQGIMSNNSKIKLSKLIQESNNFVNFKSWKLPDGSQAKLYKRKKINETIEIIEHDFSPSELDLSFKNHELTINLRGKEHIINNSYLLVNAKNSERNYEINIALPEIINLSRKNIELIKNINVDADISIDDTFKFSCILISKEFEKSPVIINKIIYDKNINIESKEEFEINKIKEVEKMGNFLKNGEFDKLFNLVGLVNQSDPNQEYLKDAEAIFKYRSELDKNNIDYLYRIAISQILQKKSSEASKILLEIAKFDNNNPYLYLAMSVVDIYNFNPRNAERNILTAKKLNKNEKMKNTLETINLISNIVNLRISSFINL